MLYVSGSFNLQGTAGILDRNPSHVFINYTGASALQTKVGDTVEGFLFIPIANATLDSTFFGGLYAGNGTITLMSGAGVASPVPEPAATSILAVRGLLAAGALIRPTHGS